MSNNSFDERAATWDDPAKVERAHQVALAIRSALPLEPTMRMLEYGAGTGLVTQALRGDVGPVTLADTSAGMRDVIDRKIATGSITDARVWDVDLSVDAAPDDDFDLIVTVMTLHHIMSLDVVLAGFHALLRSGGHLCIVDLVEEDGSFHGDGFHGHHGFNQAELTSNLQLAGFDGIKFAPCHAVVRDNGTYPLFLATAVKRVA